MKPIAIKQLIADSLLLEQIVHTQGWVKSCRHSKAGFSFIVINDGSCLESLQIVASNELDNYADITRLSTGSAIKVTGLCVSSEGKNQALELQANEISITGEIEDPTSYPISKKHHSLEYLRTVAHLRPRTNIFGAITRLRNTVAYNIHRYFYQNGFQWINTPIISASDCEGAGALFNVSTLDLLNLPTTNNAIDFKQDFFGCPTHLTVSGQLQAEAYCLAFSKVYTFGPTFRAENSNTNRHLAEFWMIEPEIAFADLKDNGDLAEDFLKSLCTAVLDECAEEMSFFVDRVDKDAVKRIESLLQKDFQRIEYTEAVKLLQASKRDFEFPVAWGLDLQAEHERYLTEEYVGYPVILTNYPKDIKAFYMRQNDDQRTVAAMDVLVPGIGEIIGGGQREERSEVLEKALAKRGLKQELDWYLDLRRYGSTPHAGFGLGLERLLGYISGVANIRDLIPFPRVPGQAKF